MDKLKIGVLGTGTIVRNAHILALQSNPHAELVAAGNLRAESLKRLAKQFHIPKTYTDFDQMASDSEIDAVVNALPNYLHAPITVKMLEAGKFIDCILNDKAPSPSGNEGLWALKVLEAAYHSAQTGNAIAIK